eukprot:CAMPEP_0184480976 /NCGR_PEP_ID=MMETSP0113_2-20130426/2519_1 /TAXON_ID=91329 /ORGANISM="Norrisiella sphaerica, Strain BC52" /LENGTH=90 /DNA_ID=CAMNT_0026859823 /DNA_START=121 /DNA_END=393 /DNA_ORIENTATION=+
MRRRLGEFKASDNEIVESLRISNNVGRKAILYLKTGELPTHKKGDSTIGLTNTMAANICQPKNSLDAGNMADVKKAAVLEMKKVAEEADE